MGNVMVIAVLTADEAMMELDKKKPVIYCGDLNVAHEEIDLKNPKSNTKKEGDRQKDPIGEQPRPWRKYGAEA